MVYGIFAPVVFMTIHPFANRALILTCDPEINVPPPAHPLLKKEWKALFLCLFQRYFLNTLHSAYWLARSLFPSSLDAI
jgi:hypothetical protein